MEHSVEINELALALSLAQSQMGGAVKGAKNPFFKSTYADLQSVINAAKEPMSENGLSYMQFPYTDNGSVGVKTMLLHKSGQWIKSDFSIPAGKHDAHSYGSLITYCRRFTLQSVLGMPTQDDDGNASVLPPKKQKPADIAELLRLIDDTGTDQTKIMPAYGVSDLKDLSQSVYFCGEGFFELFIFGQSTNF